MLRATLRPWRRRHLGTRCAPRPLTAHPRSGRMANVMFLFKREGRVRVALDAAADMEARMERLAEIALDAGAEAFLPKPVEPERLLRQLLGLVPDTSSAAPVARADDVISDESGRYAS